MEATTTFPRDQAKSLIVIRDENGFGLRVGGEYPVFVDIVIVDGPAWKAGVREGDFITEVNRVPVCTYAHSQVVRMIQACGDRVELTVHSPETGNDIENINRSF